MTATACSVCGGHVNPRALPVVKGMPPVCENVRCRTTALDRYRMTHKANRIKAVLAQIPAGGPVVLVPSNPRRTSPLSASSKLQYARHLDRMFEEFANGVFDPHSSRIEAGHPESDQFPVPVRRSVGTACSACRGSCCVTGAGHAWITAATIKRVCDANPDSTPQAIKARYLSALPERTYTGSCVYHTSAGCSLDASLRSGTCHRYLCDGAQNLVELMLSREVEERRDTQRRNSTVRVAATEGSRVVRVRRVPVR